MPKPRFRALRVQQTATLMLKSAHYRQPPPWYSAIASTPPAQPCIRTRTVQHNEAQRIRTKKASKMFLPQTIRYEEDQFRRQFYRDHPWELARPRLLLETFGMDGLGLDWSKMQQPHRATDGERYPIDGIKLPFLNDLLTFPSSVVQRQLWLLESNPSMTTSKAYDQARHEFYAIRYQEDVERRVAKEEALATGAHFGKSNLEIGMGLEDKAYEEWKTWAVANAQRLEQARTSSITAEVVPESERTVQEDPAVEAPLGDGEDPIVA